VDTITLKQSSDTKSESLKPVAIYCRVSTNQQSVENQLLDLQKVATRNNWEVVGVYTDEGVSDLSPACIPRLMWESEHIMQPV